MLRAGRVLIIGLPLVPHPINSKGCACAGSGFSHRGVCFGRLAGLLVGQEDVQHGLPAWLCGGTGVYLCSAMFPGFLAKCDIHPRAPVSVLRGGVKDASGWCILRGGRETLLMKGGSHVNSGVVQSRISQVPPFPIWCSPLNTACVMLTLFINTFIPSMLNQQYVVRSVPLISLPSPWVWSIYYLSGIHCKDVAPKRSCPTLKLNSYYPLRVTGPRKGSCLLPCATWRGPGVLLGAGISTRRWTHRAAGRAEASTLGPPERAWRHLQASAVSRSHAAGHRPASRGGAGRLWLRTVDGTGRVPAPSSGDDGTRAPFGLKERRGNSSTQMT